MVRILGLVSVIVLMLTCVSAEAQLIESSTQRDSVAATGDSGAVAPTVSNGTTIVYYFHGSKRCMTCRKIEALAEQSLRTGFDANLADSTVQWRVVNFEEEANAHFAKEYKLFSQTLIVSRQVNGEEIAWRNLDRIWTLVHNEQDFIAYVQEEVTALMSAEPE